MTRLSGITPSGHVQLGNYLGAIRRWPADAGADDLFFVSDLHALASPHNPAKLRVLTREFLAVIIAAGVAPEQVFVQSDLVGEHAALAWVLECVCTFGEARRMTQFKEKSAGQSSVKLGLLTYPVLMAADILLYGVDEVPVGADQTQHVELARTLAKRFNGAYGQVFAVPRLTVPDAAARIRDLSDPTRKMAKSSRDASGVIFVLDEPDVIHRKIARAVTDALGSVRYAPEEQPGVANLLDILAACTGVTPIEAANGLSGYAELKEATATAVIDELRDVRKRAADLLADPAELDRIRAAGARRAREHAQPRLTAALRMVGLR